MIQLDPQSIPCEHVVHFYPTELESPDPKYPHVKKTILQWRCQRCYVEMEPVFREKTK